MWWPRRQRRRVVPHDVVDVLRWWRFVVLRGSTRRRRSAGFVSQVTAERGRSTRDTRSHGECASDVRPRASGSNCARATPPLRLSVATVGPTLVDASAFVFPFSSGLVFEQRVPCFKFGRSCGSPCSSANVPSLLVRRGGRLGVVYVMRDLLLSGVWFFSKGSRR